MYTHIMERNLPNTIVDAHADSKLLRKIKKKTKERRVYSPLDLNKSAAMQAYLYTKYPVEYKILIIFQLYRYHVRINSSNFRIGLLYLPFIRYLPPGFEHIILMLNQFSINISLTIHMAHAFLLVVSN